MSKYYAKIPNEVFHPDSGLTRKARQILLVLESRAGNSRVAHLSVEEIVEHTGYGFRTTERHLAKLITGGWAARTSEKKIRLLKPVPSSYYVRAFEGIIFHSKWEDWQIQILLFVMSQFSSEGLILNKYGTKGDSITRCCSIPGSQPERRKRMNEFLKELFTTGILKVTRPHTSKRPAICEVSIAELEKLVPKSLCYVSGGGSAPLGSRQTRRSKPDNRDIAARQPRHSKPDNRDIASPPPETYFKKRKETVRLQKNPNPPSSACSGRERATSSREPGEGNGSPQKIQIAELNEHDSCSESNNGNPPFLKLIKNDQARQLASEVHNGSIAFQENESKMAPKQIAEKWELLVEELPPTVTKEDVLLALQAQEFNLLLEVSWGLMMSDNFIFRFASAIQSNHNERQEMISWEQDQRSKVIEQLSSSDPKTARSAISSVVNNYPQDSEVAIRKLIPWLVDSERDIDPIQRGGFALLLASAVNNSLSDSMKNRLVKVAKHLLDDPDEVVADYAGRCLAALDELSPVAS